jgi:hypothetical protein
MWPLPWAVKLHTPCSVIAAACIPRPDKGERLSRGLAKCRLIFNDTLTTKQFLSHFGFDTLRDLPDMEQLEDAGLLSKQKLLAGALPENLRGTSDLINIEERVGEDSDLEERPLALSSEDL